MWKSRAHVLQQELSQSSFAHSLHKELAQLQQSQKTLQEENEALTSKVNRLEIDHAQFKNALEQSGIMLETLAQDMSVLNSVMESAMTVLSEKRPVRDMMHS